MSQVIGVVSLPGPGHASFFGASYTSPERYASLGHMAECAHCNVSILDPTTYPPAGCDVLDACTPSSVCQDVIGGKAAVVVADADRVVELVSELGRKLNLRAPALGSAF